MEEFLHHHAAPGIAERRSGQHGFERRLGFGYCLGDDHTLAGGQAVRFDNHRHRAFAHIGLGGRQPCEGLRGGRWNAPTVQKRLGVGLGALQLGGFSARPEAAQAPLVEVIGKAIDQGRLRADDREIDALPLRKRRQTGKVTHRNGHVLDVGFQRSARIARRHIHTRHRLP